MNDRLVRYCPIWAAFCIDIASPSHMMLLVSARWRSPMIASASLGSSPGSVSSTSRGAVLMLIKPGREVAVLKESLSATGGRSAGGGPAFWAEAKMLVKGPRVLAGGTAAWALGGGLR